VEIDETYVPGSYKRIKRTDGRKARKHGESAEKRELSEEKLCIFMGTNRIGSKTAHCVNRAKPGSHEVIEVFGSSICIRDSKTYIDFSGCFIEMDNQEKLTVFVQKTKYSIVSLTNRSVKTQNLLKA